MISVIVPFHNEQATLSRCIESLQSQTYPNWEALMVDDGSTDNSAAICEEYQKSDSRIRLFRQQKQGVSSARNTGLAQAKGESVTFIDADDWVGNDFLQTFVDNSDGEQLCIQDMQMHRNGGATSTLGIKDVTTTDPACIARSTRLFGSCCNALFLTGIIRKHNLLFDTRLSRCEDTDFIMRYSLYINKVRTTSHAAYHYYMPDARKTYGTSTLLYTSVKLYENMLALTSNLDKSERKKILEEEAKEDVDWAIEGIFYYPHTEKEDLKGLLAKFRAYLYPWLHLSHRKSYRHRLFKLLCITSNPKYVWLLSCAIMNLQRIADKLPIRRQKEHL